MLTRLAGSFVKNELENVKRRIAGLAIIIFALSFVFLASVFGLLAAYLWLSEHVVPWQAALIIMAMLLSIAFILVLIGRRLLHRRREPRSKPEPYVNKQVNPQEAGTDRKTNPLLTLIATAAVVGFSIGRRVSK